MSHFLHFYTDIITVLFLLGGIGSTMVLVITFWEDLRTIMGHEERTPKREQPVLTPAVSRPSGAR